MSSFLLAVALWLLPPGRAEWGEAMRAELASLSTPAARRGFALSCVRASLGAGQLLRLAKYVAIVAGTVALARLSGVRSAVQVEVILVGATAPLVVWRLGRRTGPLGAVGPTRTARVARRAIFVMAGAGLAIAAGYLSTMPVPQTSAIVAALAVLVTLLAGYLALAFALTAIGSRARTSTLSVSGIFGAAAGLLWCALKPYNETLALPGVWPGAAPGALALTAVGLPAAAAVLAIRRGRAAGWEGPPLPAAGHSSAGRQDAGPGPVDAWQGSLAGAGTGVVAGLVILVGGTATVWSFPRLLDTTLVDSGPRWRPPDLVEQVIPGYFWLLVLAPMFGALVGWLVGNVLAPAHPKTSTNLGAAAQTLATRTGAVATLLALGLLAYPYSYIVDNDLTGFRQVGTTNVVFPPAGGTLLTANADYTWILWNVSDPARPTRLATFNDQAVYSPDGRTLASRNLLWSVADPTHAVRVAQLGSGEPLAFSPDGTLLVTLDRGTTMLWNVADRGHPVHLANVGARTDSEDEDVIFSPDGRVLFAGADDAVALWDVRNPQQPTKLATVTAPGDFTLSPDGGTLGFGRYDGPVALWRVTDPAQPVPLGILPGTAGEKFAFSPDQVIATANTDGAVQLWRVPDKTLAGTIPGSPPQPQVGASDAQTTMVFSPDGHTLSIVSSNATASRWDLTDPTRPTLLGTVTRTSYGAGVVRFSPDATVVAGAAADATDNITLWRVA
jgi:WD40 repeat protein